MDEEQLEFRRELRRSKTAYLLWHESQLSERAARACRHADSLLTHSEYLATASAQLIMEAYRLLDHRQSLLDADDLP
jgi:hypothetical protein